MKKKIMHKSMGENIFDISNFIFMIVLITVMLYPLYYVFIVSISNGMVVMMGRVNFYPIQVTFDTYRVLLNNSIIFNSMKNTVIYTVSGTCLSLLLSSLCAFPLSR